MDKPELIPPPKHTLHVNGSTQITGELNIGRDDKTPGNPGKKGQILISREEGSSPYWSDYSIPQINSETAGTVIVVNGDLKIAQEIRVQLEKDFYYTDVTTASAIPYLSNVIIDNENSFTSGPSGNSFTVNKDGIYMVILNYLIQDAKTNSNPVVGIWDDTENKWIARINDAFNAPNTNVSQSNQTYTLIKANPLYKDHVYSLRVGNTSPFILKSTSSGKTGSGQVSMISIKRLK